MPPEKNRNTFACDTWAFGSTVYHLLFGGQFFAAFFHSHATPVRRLPVEELGHPEWRNMQLCRTLINNCWKLKMKARPTFRVLLTTFWATQFQHEH